MGGGGVAQWQLFETSYLGKHSGKDLVKSFPFQNICWELSPYHDTGINKLMCNWQEKSAQAPPPPPPPTPPQTKQKQNNNKIEKYVCPLEYEQVPIGSYMPCGSVMSANLELDTLPEKGR